MSNPHPNVNVSAETPAQRRSRRDRIAVLVGELIASAWLREHQLGAAPTPVDAPTPLVPPPAAASASRARPPRKQR